MRVWNDLWATDGTRVRGLACPNFCVIRPMTYTPMRYRNARADRW